MKHTLIVIAFSLAASGPLWAKGEMVLIEIKGTTLLTPIRITDPKIESFTPWNGPGVNGARAPNADGFIVDWHAGVVSQKVAQPVPGLQHYEVSFYEGCRTKNDWCTEKEPRLVYVVSYDYDPFSPRGFIYLPGKGDPSYYINMSTISRWVEGNWFLATNSWEEFVRPVIAKAMNPRASLDGGKQGCLVTIAPDPPFVPPPPFRADVAYDRFLYGTSALWTLIDPNILRVNAGSKLPYYRQDFDGTEGPDLRLAVVARRLDVRDQLVWGRAHSISLDGTMTGAFLVTGLDMATPGCWEIAARYTSLRGESQTLTYTVWVEQDRVE